MRNEPELFDTFPTRPSVTISSITMSDETVIDVANSSIVVFVGPNSSGKSQSLRDLQQHIAGRPDRVFKAITTISLNYEGNEPLIIATLRSQGAIVDNQAGQSSVHLPGLVCGLTGICEQWNEKAGLGNLTSYFVLFADASARLQTASSVQNIDPMTQTPVNPLHQLYFRPDLETELSNLTKRVFGKGVAVDRFAGIKIYLRIGDPPPCVGTTEIIEYTGALRQLPPIESEGDGIRAFVGLASHIIAGNHTIMLVDEPEAFLHPPQARLIGEMLANQHEMKRQVFVATHSTDVLKGLLTAEDSMTIVRLTRESDRNPVHVLRPSDVQELWSDPILRYSNVFDSLFHDMTVICESDADCRFYGSILDVLRVETLDDHKYPGIFFTHCGGKHRMPVVIKALRAVGVTVRTVADFDILRDANLLGQIVEALGGEWSTIENHHRIIKSDLDQRLEAPYLIDVRSRLDEIFNGKSGSGDRLSTEQAERARDVLKTRSGWDRAKESGAAALGSGNPTQAWQRLDVVFRSVGLFVVPEGELEGFVREVGGHGPSWVTEVHEKDLHKNATEARTFVSEFVRSSSMPTL